jgi:hypothetical protein
MARRAVGAKAYWLAPTLLWLNASDRALDVLVWIGLIASVAIIINITPRIAIAVAGLCFLSFIGAAQDFASYQSDGMLLEAAFLSLFFAGRKPPTRASTWLLRWEWFRIYFESGLVKLMSGEPQWRNLTAMDKYYENGPLPSWPGWYVQHWPHSFHAASAALTLIVELFVVWLDAHADYNTPATTLSGNMHGMSAAFLCGEPGLDGLLGDEPRASIDPGQLELFGVRSIDKLENDLLRDRRVSVADMRQIDEFGVSVLIRRVIDKVKSRNGVLHVSFDVDFLDPSLAPGVGTTVPGGATYREAHLVMELLHDSGLVRSADIVELNPFLDERGRTARTAVELIGSLFGQQITDRPTPTNAIEPGE